MRKEIKIASGIGFVGLVALAVIGWQLKGRSSATADKPVPEKITHSSIDDDSTDIWRDASREPAGHTHVASPPPVIPDREPQQGDRPRTDITREDLPGHPIVPLVEETPISEAVPTPAEEDTLADHAESEERPTPSPIVTPEPATSLRAPAVTPPADTGERFSRAPVTAPPAGLVVTSQPAARMREYVIKPGDNLSIIAARYYGHAKYADELIKANPGIKPRQLRVGMKINIPELATTTAPAGQTPPAVPAAPTRIVSETLPPIPPERAYRVQPGEGWYELAARFLGNGNDWPELYEENKGRVPHNPQDLRAGTLIQLPERAVKNKNN